MVDSSSKLAIFYLVSCALRASSWLLIWKVTFYFIFTPFPGGYKLSFGFSVESSVTILCSMSPTSKICFSGCTVMVQEAGVPAEQQVSTWAAGTPGRKAGNSREGISAWHRTRKHLLSLSWQGLHQTPCSWKSGLGGTPWFCPALSSCLRYRELQKTYSSSQ